MEACSLKNNIKTYDGFGFTSAKVAVDVYLMLIVNGPVDMTEFSFSFSDKVDGVMMMMCALAGLICLLFSS